MKWLWKDTGRKETGPSVEVHKNDKITKISSGFTTNLPRHATTGSARRHIIFRRICAQPVIQRRQNMIWSHQQLEGAGWQLSRVSSHLPSPPAYAPCHGCGLFGREWYSLSLRSTCSKDGHASHPLGSPGICALPKSLPSFSGMTHCAR